MMSSRSKFTHLPSDIFRSLAIYLPVKDIISFIQLNKKLSDDIYHNRLFCKNIAKSRLTEHEDRIISNINIFKEIRSKNLIIAAEKGYEKQVAYLIKKLRVNKDVYRSVTRLIIIFSKKHNHLDIDSDPDMPNNMIQFYKNVVANLTTEKLLSEQLDNNILTHKKHEHEVIAPCGSLVVSNISSLLADAIALGRIDHIKYLLSVIDYDINIKQRYFEYIFCEQ